MTWIWTKDQPLPSPPSPYPASITGRGPRGAGEAGELSVRDPPVARFCSPGPCLPTVSANKGSPGRKVTNACEVLEARREDEWIAGAGAKTQAEGSKSMGSEEVTDLLLLPGSSRGNTPDCVQE